jgi:hypothetical protein
MLTPAARPGPPSGPSGPYDAAWSAVPRVLTLIVAALGTSSADRDADGSSGLGLAITVAVASVALFALTLVLKRWMHGAEEPEAAGAPGVPSRSAGAGPASVDAPPDAPHASPARQMFVGPAAWAIGGLLMTVLSYSATEGGGRYVVTYGAIIYGVVTFFRGLAGSRPSKDRRAARRRAALRPPPACLKPSGWSGIRADPAPPR